MRLNLERTSVVLAGAWNPAIFNDKWVAARVFETDSVQAQIGLMFAGGVIAQFALPSFEMQVQSARLQFKWRGMPLDIGAVESAALACLEALPETPIQAVGINFAFDIESPPSQLSEVLQLRDEPALTSFGAQVQRTLVQRMLTHADGTINLVVSSAPGLPLELDLNHHRDVGVDGTAKKAAATLAGAIGRCRDRSLEFLTRVYGLNASGAI